LGKIAVKGEVQPVPGEEASWDGLQRGILQKWGVDMPSPAGCLSSNCLPQGCPSVYEGRVFLGDLDKVGLDFIGGHVGGHGFLGLPSSEARMLN
jgi:hypothetical protein